MKTLKRVGFVIMWLPSNMDAHFLFSFFPTVRQPCIYLFYIAPVPVAVYSVIKKKSKHNTKQLTKKNETKAKKSRGQAT